MKQFIFIVSFCFFTSSLYSASPTYLYDELQEAIECQICGTQENVFAFCSTNKEHVPACPDCCSELFEMQKCTVCKQPLKTFETCPEIYKKAIEQDVERTCNLKLSKRIDLKRINPITGTIQALQNILKSPGADKSFNADNIRNTKKAFKREQKKLDQWNLILTVLNYQNALKKRLKEKKEKFSEEEIRLLSPHNKKTKSLIKSMVNDVRFQMLSEKIYKNLYLSESHPEEHPPNINQLASAKLTTNK